MDDLQGAQMCSRSLKVPGSADSGWIYRQPTVKPTEGKEVHTSLDHFEDEIEMEFGWGDGVMDGIEDER